MIPLASRSFATSKLARKSPASTAKTFSAIVTVSANVRLVREEELARSPVKNPATIFPQVKIDGFRKLTIFLLLLH